MREHLLRFFVFWEWWNIPEAVLCDAFGQVWRWNFIDERNKLQNLFFGSVVMYPVENGTGSVNKHIWQLQVLTCLFNLAFDFHVKEHRLAVGAHGRQQAKVRNLQSFCKRGKVHRILVVHFDEVILAVLLNRSQSANKCIVALELWRQIT